MLAMRNKAIQRIAMTILIACIFMGCAEQGPVDVIAGQERCAHCRMDVADLRFNAQLITSKGKRYHFDSIECMESWKVEHPEQTVTHSYVKNYFNPKQSIEWEKAKVLYSKRVPSPMGAYLSAFATDDEMVRALAEYGGTHLEGQALQTKLHEWTDRFGKEP